MEKNRKEYIEKYIILIFSILLGLKYTIFSNFSFFNYIFPLLVCISYLYILFSFKKIFSTKYIKNNFLIILYFIVKLIILLFFKFDLTSFIYDGFFLIIIYTLINKSESNVKLLSKSIIYLTLLINIISIIYCYFDLLFFEGLSAFYYHGTSVYLKGIYINSNGLGLLSFYALCLYFTFFKSSKFNFTDLLHEIFFIMFIYFSGSRTALLVTIVFIFSKIILQIFNKRFVVTLFCSGLSLVLCALFYVVYINKDEIKLTNIEEKINSFSTNRYLLTKYSILSLDENTLIGVNKKEIAEKRFEKIPYEIKRELEYNRILFAAENNNNHNGYIQIFVSYGLILFIIFILIIYQGLYRTNKKLLPLLFAALIVSLFENELILSLGLPIIIILICLGFKKKTDYKPNTDEILYINYINMKDDYSGSAVRPTKIYQAFLKKGLKVKMLTGTILKNNKRNRVNSIKEIKLWLKTNRPKFCYIESPGGPIIFREDKKLIRYLNELNIPISYFYRDCYYKFPTIYIFEGNVKFFSKKFLKYLYQYIHYFINNVLIKNNVDIVYMPSLKMGHFFNFDIIKELPPAADKYKFDKNNTRDKIIYVGGISKNYGIDLLLSSIEKINKKQRIELLLICRKSEISNISDKYLNKGWLNIIHASGKELDYYYKQAKIAVLPKKKNKYNDFSISVKLFEYLSYGLPIVATSSTASDKIIVNNNIGLISKNNSEEFANTILEIYNNKDIYNKAINNIKEYVDSEGLWIHRVEKIIDDFENGEYYAK